MLNKIVVMGRIVNDLELKQTGGGINTCSFNIACDRDFKNKDGQKETDFIPVVTWRHTAEFVCRYMGKGRMVVAEGRLQIRQWEKDGQKHSKAEIVADNVYFADSKKSEGEGFAQPTQTFAEIREEDDELPF